MATPQPDIPPFLSGDTLMAAPLEAMRQQVARQRVSVAPPLELYEHPGGVTIRYTGGNVSSYAVTTSSASASTGVTNLGSGTASLRKQSGTSLSATGGDDVTVYNQTNQTIASGTLVTLLRVTGQWSVIQVDKCSNLSS